MKILIILTLLLWRIAPAALAEPPSGIRFDHSEWDQFLKKYVNEKGEVNYRTAKEDPSLLDAYLEKLRSFSLKEFFSWPREERLALLINAYNAGVVRTVLSHYPLKSIMQVPGGWEQSIVRIGHPLTAQSLKAQNKSGSSSERAGARLSQSLNQIENGELRMGFRDEKILFALCRGAKDSPRLRREAYEGSKVDGQLYLAAKEFANDEAKNHIVPGEKKVVLSRLFYWYARDFLLNWSNVPVESKWAPEELAVLSFFAHYLDDLKKVEYLEEGNYKVKYSIFNWDLNDGSPKA